MILGWLQLYTSFLILVQASNSLNNNDQTLHLRQSNGLDHSRCGFPILDACLL